MTTSTCYVVYTVDDFGETSILGVGQTFQDIVILMNNLKSEDNTYRLDYDTPEEYMKAFKEINKELHNNNSNNNSENISIPSTMMIGELGDKPIELTQAPFIGSLTANSNSGSLIANSNNGSLIPNSNNRNRNNSNSNNSNTRNRKRARTRKNRK